MDKLRLSIDVFSKELGEDVAFTKLSSERDAVIERFAVYDEHTFLLSSDCLYLCLGSEFPPCKRIQEGTGIVCSSSSFACSDPDCHRCDLIVLKDVGAATVVNKVSSILSRYQEYGRSIELAVHQEDGLQSIMDVGEEMIGAPLCLFDAHENVLAASNHQALFGNPLWETVVRGNKPTRCEILDACAQEVSPERPLLHNAAIRAVGVSGYSLLARSVFRRGRPCASLWAMATKPGRLFPPAEFKLFAWIARCLDEWVEGAKLVQGGRGMRAERFLLDLADGTLCDTTGIEAAANKVGFELSRADEYQLCVLKPRSPLASLENGTEDMREIEGCAPGTICAMEDYGLLALFTLREGSGCELEERATSFLHTLCETRGYNAVLSTAFFSLNDIPRVLKQLLDCYTLVQFDEERGGLHFYKSHIVQQVMHMVMTELPPETLLHPMVRNLQAYDQENGTEFLETFKVYLNNRCNAAETSAQLHMHRNTLLNRIRRIEEILGQSFDDWTLRRTLLLSIDYLYLGEDKPI